MDLGLGGWERCTCESFGQLHVWFGNILLSRNMLFSSAWSSSGLCSVEIFKSDPLILKLRKLRHGKKFSPRRRKVILFSYNICCVEIPMKMNSSTSINFLMARFCLQSTIGRIVICKFALHQTLIFFFIWFRRINLRFRRLFLLHHQRSFAIDMSVARRRKYENYDPRGKMIFRKIANFIAS